MALVLEASNGISSNIFRVAPIKRYLHVDLIAASYGSTFRFLADWTSTRGSKIGIVGVVAADSSRSLGSSRYLDLFASIIAL